MESIGIGVLGQKLIPPKGAKDDDPVSGTHEFCGGKIENIQVARCFRALTCSRCGQLGTMFVKIDTFRALRAMETAWRFADHVRLAEGRTTAWYQAVIQPLLEGDEDAAKRAMLAFPTGVPLSPEEHRAATEAWSDAGAGPPRIPATQALASSGRHGYGRKK